MNNIIRIDEGGVSNPYVVIERMSQFATPHIPDGMKLIREQRGQEVFLLLCEPIRDAEWSDIPTDGESKSRKSAKKV